MHQTLYLNIVGEIVMEEVFVQREDMVHNIICGDNVQQLKDRMGYGYSAHPRCKTCAHSVLVENAYGEYERFCRKSYASWFVVEDFMYCQAHCGRHSRVDGA